MSPVVLSLAGLFVLAYGAVAIFALRHRVLGRLALREAVRRKGQSLLVVAGLMVGTAAITAARVAPDPPRHPSPQRAFHNSRSLSPPATPATRPLPTTPCHPP